MKKYLSFIKNNYGLFRYKSDKNILEKLNNFKNINYRVISDNNGFCIIYNDNRLSTDICFFGFLEIYNKENSNAFISKIKKEAKQISSNNNILLGPINLSIWNSYRIGNFDKKDDVIDLEYQTSPFLNEIFKSNGFSIYEEYITAKRLGNNPYTISDFNKGSYSVIKTGNNKQTIKDIFNLSIKIFAKAPKIEYSEFEDYMKVYIDLYKDNLGEFFLLHNNKKIGFVSSYYNNEYFVIKTIGILDEYRGRKLGNFLLKNVYDYYLNKGLKESYYLYMRQDGDALNMTNKNATLYRKYYTYYTKI